VDYKIIIFFLYNEVFLEINSFLVLLMLDFAYFNTNQKVKNRGIFLKP